MYKKFKLFILLFTISILFSKVYGQIAAPGDVGVSTGTSVPLDNMLLSFLLTIGTFLSCYLKKNKKQKK